MMDTKPFDPTDDLTACQAMAAEFDAYLRSEVLYWQLDAARPGGNRLPRLTVSGFLERARRLQAATLTPAQQSALNEAVRRFEQGRDSQYPSYVTHAVHDLRGLLNSWQWYLDDYAAKPEEHAPYYPVQSHTRLAMQVLMDELQSSPQTAEFANRVLALDNRLRGDWIEGVFVWHSSLAHAFPRDRFWWLYGRLRGKT
jgi:hypothetical protein